MSRHLPSTIGPEPWRCGLCRAIVVQRTVVTEKPSLPTTNSKWSQKPSCSTKHQELYLESLEKVGINPLEHDIRFTLKITEENPSTGFSWSRLGSWLDGIKSLSSPTSNKLVDWQLVSNFWDSLTDCWFGCLSKKSILFTILVGSGVKYGEIFLQPEYEHSKYESFKFLTKMLLEASEKFERSGTCWNWSLVHSLWLRFEMFTYLQFAWCSLALYPLQNVPVTLPTSVTTRHAKTFVAERKKLGYPYRRSHTQTPSRRKNKSTKWKVGKQRVNL